MIGFSYIVQAAGQCQSHGHHRRLGKNCWYYHGGLLIYAISTIIFIIGIRMAGKRSIHVFCRQMACMVLEKILGDDVRMLSESGSSDKDA